MTMLKKVALGVISVIFLVIGLLKLSHTDIYINVQVQVVRGSSSDSDGSHVDSFQVVDSNSVIPSDSEEPNSPSQLRTKSQSDGKEAASNTQTDPPAVHVAQQPAAPETAPSEVSEQQAEQETPPPNLLQPEERQELCRHAFLAGMEPGLANAQQRVHVPDNEKDTLISSWQEQSCGELYCHNFHADDAASVPSSLEEDYNNGKCHWTTWAVKQLIPNETEALELCNQQILDSYYADPIWDSYRIADYFKGLGHLYEHPPGSLMDEYWHRTQEYANVDILYDIIQKRVQGMNSTNSTIIPEKDTLLIHLRAGDVIDDAAESVMEMLYHQTYYYRVTNANDKSNLPWVHPNDPPLKEDWNAYTRPLKHFSAAINNQTNGHLEQFQSNSNNFKSIVIMAAAHDNHAEGGKDQPTFTTLKSCLYTRAIQRYLQRRVGPAVNVTLRLGHPPDDDVIYGSQAKAFLPTGGGYSHLIATLAERAGGSVWSD